MAKYVNFTPNVYAKMENGVHVWRLPSSFSQSQLGDRVIGSNACTLITVLLAGKFHENEITVWGFSDQPLSRMLVTSIAESIIDGNDLHDILIRSGQLVELNLTVPEAINAAAYKYPSLKEWHESTQVIVTEPIESSLAKYLKLGLSDFHHRPPRDISYKSDIYVILVADGRSVLFSYQLRTSKITLIDSHSHPGCGCGAIVAQARIGELEKLCDWYMSLCYRSYGKFPTGVYELAYLYFKA